MAITNVVNMVLVRMHRVLYFAKELVRAPSLEEQMLLHVRGHMSYDV